MQAMVPLSRNRIANFLIETSPVAIFLTTPRGMISQANPVAREWFGYDDVELTGMAIERLFRFESRGDAEAHSSCFMSHVRDPEPGKKWWLSARRRDKTFFLTKVCLHALETDAGEIRLINVVSVTDHDWCYRRHLECERLAAVSQMVSGLSHESRNAMQRAESCLDLLEMDLETNSESRQLTHRIRNALRGIHRNYEEVREYAAPILLKRSVVEMPQLLRVIVDQWSWECGADSNVSISCAAELPAVSFDVDRLRVLLRHLLDNALHASPPGKEIEIRCQRFQREQTRGIEISVRDYGSGINDETKQCMFEPFFTNKQQGTGLGLAVCQRIAEAHNGTIEASNHPAGGAVMHVYFPQEFGS